MTDYMRDPHPGIVKCTSYYICQHCGHEWEANGQAEGSAFTCFDLCPECGKEQG